MLPQLPEIKSDGTIGAVELRNFLYAIQVYLDENSGSSTAQTIVIHAKDIDNLVVAPDVSDVNSKLSITFDSVYIGGVAEESFSEVISITEDLDTGVEAVSTWYYVWLIKGDGETTRCIFSTSVSSPVLPSGYTDAKLLSCVYNKSDGNFQGFKQINKYYGYEYFYFYAGQFIDNEFSLLSCIPEKVYKFNFKAMKAYTEGNHTHLLTYGKINGEWQWQGGYYDYWHGHHEQMIFTESRSIHIFCLSDYTPYVELSVNGFFMDDLI